MHDQADELRQLVRRADCVQCAARSAAAPLVVVAGGKGGVGTTTIAANLAVALGTPRSPRRVRRCRSRSRRQRQPGGASPSADRSSTCWPAAEPFTKCSSADRRASRCCAALGPRAKWPTARPRPSDRFVTELNSLGAARRRGGDRRRQQPRTFRPPILAGRRRRAGGDHRPMSTAIMDAYAAIKVHGRRRRYRAAVAHAGQPDRRHGSGRRRARADRHGLPASFWALRVAPPAACRLAEAARRCRAASWCIPPAPTRPARSIAWPIRCGRSCKSTPRAAAAARLRIGLDRMTNSSGKRIA